MDRIRGFGQRAMGVRQYLLLERFSGGADWVLLALRVVVGAFLVWGVWDNIVSGERMAEFAAFLAHHGFIRPEWLAPLSVWAQFACGVAFILGIGTRWAGLICAFNFLVALAFVDAKGGIRTAFPSTVLILLGLYFATRGAGRYAIDAHLSRTKR